MSSDPPEAKCFTPLASVALAHAQILHPKAANPAMDLVVLLHESPDASVPPPQPFRPGMPLKPKPKATGPGTKIVLWRLSGSKVWEVEITGRVLGLAWTPDGLYLSLLVLKTDKWPAGEAADTKESTIEHLSVHTGDVVKAVPAPPQILGAIGSEDFPETREGQFQWWDLEWLESRAEWEKAKPGSALMIIDSLPNVTPVEPPKPPILNPFAIPSAEEAKKAKGVHEKLTSAPALLPANPPVPPDVLCIAPPPSRKGDKARLLTGSFLLPPGTPLHLRSTLDLARRGDMVTRLLDVVVRGFESMQAVYKDGEKQTFIWRDELEICGDQQGMSVEEVHADLFRFLMAGRSGPAVSEWLGNRMANRAVAKWEATLNTEFSTIQSILAQSVLPALERILLVIEELGAWASDQLEGDFILDHSSVARAKELGQGLLRLCEDMRQSARLEGDAATEWFKWIRHEIKHSVSFEETLPLPTHDLKLVWSFMKNGFRHSRFKSHFPDGADAKDDLLPADIPVRPAAQEPKLDAVIAATLSSLTSISRPSGPDAFASPDPIPDYSFASSHASPFVNRAASPDVSSPDTVADTSIRQSETERTPALEPWAWANSLVAVCSDVIRTARVRDPLPGGEDDRLLDSLSRGSFMDQRVVEEIRWSAYIYDNILGIGGSVGTTLHMGTFSHAGTLLQAAFYDDEELALIIKSDEQVYLCTVRLEALGAVLVEVNPNAGHGVWKTEPHELPLARTRLLGPASKWTGWMMAFNGNPGRKSGWILTRGGREMEVFDMENDEGEDMEE